MQTIELRASRRPNQIHRYLYYAICTAAMVGLFELVRFLVTGINDSFGHGFFIGVVFAAALFYLGTRAEESSKSGG